MRTTWVLLFVATLSLALSVSAELTGVDDTASQTGSFPSEVPRVGRRGLLDDGGIAALLDLAAAPSYGYYYGGAALPAQAKLESLRRRLLADAEFDSMLTASEAPGAYGYGYSSYGSADSSFTRRLLQLDDASLLTEASGSPGSYGYGYYPSAGRRLLSSERVESLGRRLLQSTEFLSLTQSEGTYGYGYYGPSPSTSRRLLSVVTSKLEAIRRSLLSEDTFLTSSTPGSGGYGYYYGGEQLPSRRLLTTQLESIHRKLLADDDGLTDMLEAMGSTPGYGYGYGYASSGRRLLAATGDQVDEVMQKLMQ